MTGNVFPSLLQDKIVNSHWSFLFPASMGGPIISGDWGQGWGSKTKGDPKGRAVKVFHESVDPGCIVVAFKYES